MISSPSDQSFDLSRNASRVADVPAFLSALEHAIPSAEPAVVFTSLASICVPALADECLVLVEQDGDITYQITRPLPTAATATDTIPDWASAPASTEAQVSDHWISTPILAPRSSMGLLVRGVLIHRWHDEHRPTPTDAALAHIALDRAMSMISQQQSADRLRAAELRAANLQIALETNREIGAAIGILMASLRLSQTEAFDLLRGASQHHHCKLRQIADSVVLTGALDPDLFGPPAHRRSRPTPEPDGSLASVTPL